MPAGGFSFNRLHYFWKPFFKKQRCLGWIRPFLSKLGFIPLDNIKELRKTEARRKNENFSHGIFRGWIQFICPCFACSLQQCGQASAGGERSLVFYLWRLRALAAGWIVWCDPVDSSEINKKRESMGGVANSLETKNARENLFYAFHKRFERRHVWASRQSISRFNLRGLWEA